MGRIKLFGKRKFYGNRYTKKKGGKRADVTMDPVATPSASCTHSFCGINPPSSGLAQLSHEEEKSDSDFENSTHCGFTIVNFKEEPEDIKDVCTWNSIASYNAKIVSEEEGDSHPITFSVKEENNAEEEELEPPEAVFLVPFGTFEDEPMQEEDTFSPTRGRVPKRRKDVRSCPTGAEISHSTNINSVNSLLQHPFLSRSIEEKCEIKRLGRPKPLLQIYQSVQSKTRAFNRKFNLNVYHKYDWICGCEVRSALFCFCCILFGGEDTWTKQGLSDLHHLHDRCKKHSLSKIHMKNTLSLAMLGNENKAQQIDSVKRKAMEVHNQKVAQNRHVLNIVINCIKFCGSLTQALGSHNESESSSHPDIFHGLINFSAELDTAIRNNLEKESVFEGFSNTIKNEILACMLEVCREEISKEIKNSDFVALIAGETGDVSVSQLYIVYRYVVNSKPVERFWGFVNSEGRTAKSLAACILSELQLHLEGCEKKLIAQSYDGASVMSGLKPGVQAIIKQKYEHAMCIHCYAHQLNLVLLNAASVSKSVRIFFINLEGLCSFFSDSAERRSVLYNMVQNHLPSSNKWSIDSTFVNIIYRNRAELIECMKQIQHDGKMSRNCVLQASGFIGILMDDNFIFWLSLFQKIMPQIDWLCHQLEKCKCIPSGVREKLQKFELEILKIRSHINITIGREEGPKKTRLEKDERKREALEVCDAILTEVKERFSFVAHLGADLLFLPDKFAEYENEFPEALLKQTLEAYAFIEEKQICTELSVIYSADELKNISGAVTLMEVIRDNNISSNFSECAKLLSVLLTIPMMTSEEKRCFSHQRIKNFLCNTVTGNRSSALAMVYIEQDFIKQIPDFNERVINKFATNNERCADFMYKQIDALT